MRGGPQGEGSAARVGPASLEVAGSLRPRDGRSSTQGSWSTKKIAEG